MAHRVGEVAPAAVISEMVTDVAQLDPLVVGTPIDDGSLDGLVVEVLVEGSAGEGGKLIVGGKAEGDELGGGELVDPATLGWRKKRGEPEALFEADDAVLRLEGAAAADASYEKKNDRHDYPPAMESPVFRPVVDGVGDGKDEVEEGEGQDYIVEWRVEAGVILEVLRGGHRNSFRHR
jgi:hypothetical protein